MAEGSAEVGRQFFVSRRQPYWGGLGSRDRLGDGGRESRRSDGPLPRSALGAGPGGVAVWAGIFC